MHHSVSSSPFVDRRTPIMYLFSFFEVEPEEKCGSKEDSQGRMDDAL